LPCTAYAAKQAFPFAAQLLSNGGNVTFRRTTSRGLTALHGVHRIRWSCAAAALVFVIGLAACARGPLHDALHPRFLSGNDAADRIDVRIGGMIVAHHPSVTVGRAKCPYLINLSGNAVGH